MNRSTIAVALCIMTSAVAARASVITSDPYFAGQGRTYQQTSPAASFHVGTHTYGISFDLDMQGPAIYPPAPGGESTVTVPVLARARLDIDGNGRSDTMTDGIMVIRHVSTVFNNSWDMEIQLMNLSGGGGGGGISPAIMLREYQLFSSISNVLKTDLPGGLFQIDSFFDIFMELSVDGGQTWIPASNGPVHMNLIPSPGAAAIVGIGVIFAGRRRRST